MMDQQAEYSDIGQANKEMEVASASEEKKQEAFEKFNAEYNDIGKANKEPTAPPAKYNSVTFIKGWAFLNGQYSLEQVKAVVKHLESQNNLATQFTEITTYGT